MRSISKPFALLLTIMVALSCLMLLIVKPTEAQITQPIPKPSTPEYTLKFVDNSYDVPETTSSRTDPYTNKTTTITHPGYHVKRFDIEVTIKNQPYPSSNGVNAYNLYYDIEKKGHYENWTESYSQIQSPEKLREQSSSEYTVVNFSASYTSGAEVDFRVRAILGYTHTYYLPDHIIPIPASDFLYETSDWSPTQTFIMPTISSSPTPISLSIDDMLKITALIAVGALVLAVVSILLHRRHRKNNLHKPD